MKYLGDCREELVLRTPGSVEKRGEGGLRAEVLDVRVELPQVPRVGTEADGPEIDQVPSAEVGLQSVPAGTG